MSPRSYNRSFLPMKFQTTHALPFLSSVSLFTLKEKISTFYTRICILFFASYRGPPTGCPGNPSIPGIPGGPRGPSDPFSPWEPGKPGFPCKQMVIHQDRNNKEDEKFKRKTPSWSDVQENLQFQEGPVGEKTRQRQP